MVDIIREGFETDGNGTRYITSVAEFSDGFGDFFTRTDGSNIGSFYEVTGVTGASYFAAMDIDGEGADSEQTLELSGIDIAGFSNLQFSVDVAEDDDGTNQDWDDSDYVLFEYRIDGSAWLNLLQIAEFDDGDFFNQAPGVDTDFDGEADGVEITNVFQTLTAAIAGTGSTLDLRVTFDLDSGDEDLAIDEIVVSDGAGPVGPTYTLDLAADSVAEDGAPVTGTLTRTGDTSAEVVVALTSSDETEATVPATTTFAAGSDTATFDIDPVADGIVDLDRDVTITAAVDGTTLTDTLTLTDIDTGPILISTIQGSGATTEYAGETVTVEGIVTGVYIDGLSGYFIQEEDSDADGDIATSEGIFVFDPDASVATGDTVQLTGEVSEFFDLTQISGVSSYSVLSSGNALPTAVSATLPIIDDPANAFEAFEGMVVTFPQELTITQLFNYERFGELQLSTQGLVPQYTQINDPDPSGFAAYQAMDEATRIILDDGSSESNPDTLPYLDVDEFSAGDTIANLTGVLSYSFGDYRVQPLDAAPVEFENTIPRQESPDDVGGDVKVASFNVLNYFTTLNDGDNVTATGLEPRGANSEAELARQTSKIVAALNQMDADVVGLIEIENDDGASADALVEALNALSDRTYSAVDTGVIGTDAIKVAFIYDTETMRIADGTSVAVLDRPEFVNPIGDDPKNRPALAVTFEEIATGETFTAVNNHLKSKGSAVAGDPDMNDGQGNGALTRTLAAAELMAWLETNPTGSDDADEVILGDLNAYAMEDPIDVIKAGADGVLGTGDDFTDLAAAFIGEDAYSFRFSGQWGTLDYAMGSEGLTAKVTGVTEWHINSLEPAYLDYNDAVLDDGERFFEALSPEIDAYFDATSPYRSSDHDPIIIGLDLDGYDNRIAGTGKNDRLFGTGDRDLIEGFGKNDRLFGLAGDDDLLAGDGNDRSYGGAGDDLIRDGGGNDISFGGAGDDTFEIGGGHNDRIWTGADADTLVFSAAMAMDGARDRTVVEDFDTELDVIDLGGAEIVRVREAGPNVRLTLDGDGDQIVLRGVDSANDIIFVESDPFAMV